MNLKRSIIFLFSFLIFVPLNAQHFEFTDSYKSAYESIIKLDFKEGKLKLDQQRVVDPDNQIYIVLENYIDFLKTIIGEKEADFERFKDQKRSRLNQLKKADRESPYYNYSLAHVYLQLAFARFKFNEYLSAGFELRKAFHLLRRNQERFPEFLPSKIDFGLMHALVGAIPNKYKWLAKLAAMKGSVDQGYEEISEVLYQIQEDPSKSYLINETIFFLTFIELNLKSNYNQAEVLLDRIKMLPNDNQMLVFAKVSILNKLGRNDELIQLLESFKIGENSYELKYLTYLHGLAKLNRLDQDADIYLHDYVDSFSGLTYKRSAMQKIAWFHLLNGDEEIYKTYISKVQEVGNNIVDGDKQALTESKSGRVPHIGLLKARLLYDGGYYHKSMNLLNTFEESDFHGNHEKSEFMYRKARVLHRLNHIDVALKAYYSAYSVGRDLTDYFAGNALLQMGMIYENRGEYDRSKDYYERCIDLDFEVYKNSIEQKAKAGLNRLETKKGAK